MAGRPPPAVESPALLASLWGLTFTTGIVDAASVLGLGHVFTANMTGNVVYLAFSLAGAGDLPMLAPLVSLAAFVAGAIVGGRLVRQASSVRRVLGWELLLLAIATGVAVRDPGGGVARYAVIAVLAAAMGLQNAAARRLGVPDLTTTVVTLTLTGLAADSSLAGGTDPRWARRLLSVGLILAGALVGAWLMRFGVAVVIGASALGAAVAYGAHPRGAVLDPAK